MKFIECVILRVILKGLVKCVLNEFTVNSGRGCKSKTKLYNRALRTVRRKCWSQMRYRVFFLTKKYINKDPPILQNLCCYWTRIPVVYVVAPLCLWFLFACFPRSLAVLPISCFDFNATKFLVRSLRATLQYFSLWPT